MINSTASTIKNNRKKVREANLHFFDREINQTLPNFRKILSDNWSLLKINSRLKHVFNEQPVIAYRRNKNLRDVIGDTTIKNNKVVRKQKSTLKVVIVNHAFQEQTTFFANKLYRPQLLKAI